MVPLGDRFGPPRIRGIGGHGVDLLANAGIRAEVDRASVARPYCGVDVEAPSRHHGDGVAAIGRDDEQTLVEVEVAEFVVRVRDEERVAVVRGEGRANLAHVIVGDPARARPIGVHHPQFRVEQVVEEGRGRQLHEEQRAVARGRIPSHHQAGLRYALRGPALARNAPQSGRPLVFFVAEHVVVDGFARPLGLRLLVDRREVDPGAIAGPRDRTHGRRVLAHGAGLAASGRHHEHLVVLRAMPVRDEGDARAIGRPARARFAALAVRHARRAGAVHRDAPDVGNRAVGFPVGVRPHVQHFRSVRRDPRIGETRDVDQIHDRHRAALAGDGGGGDENGEDSESENAARHGQTPAVGGGPSRYIDVGRVVGG